MIRIATLAATAALIALPASAQSVTVSTAGKSTAQLHADILKAAKSVCVRATMGASFPREMYAACFKAAVTKAVADVGDPALAAYKPMVVATR